ncbi:hypothetical protein Tco_1172045, partial [Tanacetum coccineum]
MPYPKTNPRAPSASQPNVTQQPTSAQQLPSVNTLGQATILPNAFSTETLHDPTTGAWNIDTGASSHLNSSVTNLSENFNMRMYPPISVGDGHSIPVTNT